MMFVVWSWLGLDLISKLLLANDVVALGLSSLVIIAWHLLYRYEIDVNVKGKSFYQNLEDFP